MEAFAKDSLSGGASMACVWLCTLEIPAVGRYRQEIGSHPLAIHQVQGQPGTLPQDSKEEALSENQLSPG